MIDIFFSEIFSIQPKRKEKLDAHFMPADHLLSAFNKGFCLNGRAHLTTKNAYMSAMVLGGSGSGKSVSVVIPSIYNLSKHGHSMVIHDPSGELYLATAGVFFKQGYKIKVLHYNKPEISDGFNPLIRAKTTSDINKVANILVINALGDRNKDPFWNIQATMLLSLILRILKKQNFWFQHLTSAKLILDNMTSNPESIDLLVAQCNDKSILTEYQQFLVMDKKLLTSVIITCRSALSLFTDTDIQTVTAYDSIDFESLRTKKSVLFVQNKTGDMKYYKFLSAIFFEQFFSHLMERIPGKNGRSIFFILDESSSLYLPSLQIALANLRKFKAGIMLIAQDFNQFVHLYGTHEAESIKTNCFSKVYFPGQPLNTCNELEKLLGIYEFEDKEGNRRTRQLLTADEIRTMEPNTSLILAGANRAVKTRMKPYYRSLKYSHLAKLPLPEFKNKTPFEELPLIPLPTPESKHNK